MGRNSASEIFFTVISKQGTTPYISTFYCQQHQRWDVRSNNTLATASSALRAEFATHHGNVEQ